MVADRTADSFVAELTARRRPERDQQIQRYFKHGEGDVFIGVRMRDVFALAKEYIDLPAKEIEKLLDSPVHEARAGAVSIMSRQAARRATQPGRRKQLYELYLRRHDRIDNWDLVDLGAADVVGGYLVDRPRDVLYRLARSSSPWERRTAVVATMAFLRDGDVTDTFRIAELLLDDEHELVHKAAGWLLRTAGDTDRPALLAFLDRYAATMPRVLLRYSIEHLDKEQRAHYLGRKKAKR